MIYTHRAQKSNYSKFFLDCLSLSHHMVAFLYLIIYLNIHKQAKSRIQQKLNDQSPVDYRKLVA